MTRTSFSTSLNLENTVQDANINICVLDGVLCT
jgi:hypothetical protein